MAKRQALKPADLPLERAAYDENGTGWRVDIADFSVRIEAHGDTPRALKKAAALRLATCWNVCERIPTKPLVDGVLLDYCVAVDRLLEALPDEDLADAPELRELVQAVKAADAAMALLPEKAVRRG